MRTEGGQECGKIFVIDRGPWRSRLICFWTCSFCFKHIFPFPVCMAKRFLKNMEHAPNCLYICFLSVLFSSTVFCCLLLAFCFLLSISSSLPTLFNTHCWRNRTHQWLLYNSPSPTNPRLCRLSPTHTRNQVKTGSVANSWPKFSADPA